MTSSPKNRITIYEHQSLKLDEHEVFKNDHLKVLQRFYGEKGTNYFSLINKGVKFNQYVGVIQVGKLVVEVLPKTDKNENVDWRNLLIGMLRAVGTVKVFSTGTTNLKIRTNSVLDLYFELFVSEVEKLIHAGLIKKYHRQEENRLSLKGKISFQKHTQHNLIHQERIFVSHYIYDQNNTFNQIIKTALKLVKTLNTSSSLYNRIGAISLALPEMSDIKVTENTFNNICFNRKTEPYREVLNIARLILLNYHPDLGKGQNNVLALLFDMNKLWEKFVLQSLREYAPADFKIKGKVSKSFWQPEKGKIANIEPDIVIRHHDQMFVLDAKWKILKDNRPSDEDLKQMYVYTKYFKSSYTALVYPCNGLASTFGSFFPDTEEKSSVSCSLIRLKIPEETKNIRAWQKDICELLTNHIIKNR